MRQDDGHVGQVERRRSDAEDGGGGLGGADCDGGQEDAGEDDGPDGVEGRFGFGVDLGEGSLSVPSSWLVLFWWKGV